MRERGRPPDKRLYPRRGVNELVLHDRKAEEYDRAKSYDRRCCKCGKLIRVDEIYRAVTYEVDQFRSHDKMWYYCETCDPGRAAAWIAS